MMEYRTGYVILLMFIFCTSSKSQNKTDLSKDTIKSESKNIITSYGPKSIVRTIKPDRKGNIWIASWEGVFQYDSEKAVFTNVTRKESSARFFSILEDRKGNFWFATIGSGVYYYQPHLVPDGYWDGHAGFQNFTTKDGLANDRVGDIYEDKTGNIWFGTYDGASRYDGATFRNYRMNEGLPGFADKDDNDVNSIIEDKTGKFWFGTRGNTYVYDGKSFTIITHEGNPFSNVRKIIEDKKGNIWLGGKNGLWRYDGIGFTNFTKNFVGYIYEDKKGNIWTSSEIVNSAGGSQGWALSRYEDKSLSDKEPRVTIIQSEYENIKRMIFGIAEDNDGTIWFGALDGVYRYDVKGNTIIDSKGKVVPE